MVWLPQERLCPAMISHNLLPVAASETAQKVPPKFSAGCDGCFPQSNGPLCPGVCSCPAGHMILENASGRHCVYTACAERPCNYGTCVPLSPSSFQCHCPDGYTGQRCDITLAIFHKDTGLSFTSLFAICVCFLALLGSYGNYVLYYLW